MQSVRPCLGFDIQAEEAAAVTRLRLDGHWLLALIAADSCLQGGCIGGGLLAAGGPTIWAMAREVGAPVQCG